MYRIIALLAFVLLASACTNTKIQSKEDSLSIEFDSINVKESIERRDQSLIAYGADFIAIGSNPNWLLIINKVAKTAEFRLEDKPSEVFSLKELNYIDIYELHANNNNTDFHLSSKEEICISQETKEIMNFSVEVEIMGISFYGCGKEVRKIREIQIDK